MNISKNNNNQYDAPFADILSYLQKVSNNVTVKNYDFYTEIHMTNPKEDMCKISAMMNEIARDLAVTGLPIISIEKLTNDVLVIIYKTKMQLAKLHEWCRKNKINHD